MRFFLFSVLISVALHWSVTGANQVEGQNRVNLPDYARQMRQMVANQIRQFETQNPTLANQLKNIHLAAVSIESELAKRGPEIEQNEPAHSRYLRLLNSVGHRMAFAIKSYAPKLKAEVSEKSQSGNVVEVSKMSSGEASTVAADPRPPRITAENIGKYVRNLFPNLLVRANIGLYPTTTKLGEDSKRTAVESRQQLGQIQQSLNTMNAKLDHLVRLFAE